MSEKNPFSDPNFGLEENEPKQTDNVFKDKDYGKDPGLIRSIADTGVELGQSALTGVQLISNAAGAGNAVSKGLGDAAEFVGGFKSGGRRAEQDARGQQIKEAEESGSTWEEIKANVGAFAEAPIDTTVGAIGTSLPTIAAMALTRGRAKGLAGAVAGGVQGAGAVKGSIYDAVKQEHLANGLSEEEAEARAIEAQSYSGDNASQIALGTGLGVVAGTTGMERIAGSMARRFAGEEAADQAAKGVLRSTLTGAAVEAPVEAMQGGQERLAANIALQNEGFDTPTWEGVAGAAALEGIAGGVAGGAFGAADALTTPVNQEANPVLGADSAPDVEGAIQRQADIQEAVAPLAAQAQPVEVPATQAEEIQNQAEQPSSTVVTEPVEPREPVKPSEKLGLNPADGALSEAAALAVDSGASPQVAALVEEPSTPVAPLSEAASIVAPEQMTLMPDNVDPLTGEVLLDTPTKPDLDAIEAEYQASLDYATKQAKVTGWSNALVEMRDEALSGLERVKAEKGTDTTIQQQEAAPVEEATAKPQNLKEGIEAARAARTAKAEVPAGNEQVAGDIKAVLAKQIPQMTDAELVAAAEHLGPDHKRTAKLNKEMRKRQTSIEQPSLEQSNGEQTLETQQESTQRAQTTGAPAEAQPAIEGAKAGELKLEVQARPATGAEAADIAQAADASRKAAGEKWASMTEAERLEVAKRSGAKPVFAKNLPKADWEKIANRVQDQLAGAIMATNRQEPAASEQVATSKSKQEVMPRQEFDTAAKVGKVSAVKERYGDKYGVSWASTNIATADSMEEAAAIAKAVAVSGADNIADMREVASRRNTEPRASIEGRDLGEGWKEFSKDSGTLGIPRAEMPQIKSEHRGAMVNFLKARGVDSATDTVKAGDLKPTQAEFSVDKVAQVKASEGGDRPILVSRDNHVLDGHHHWLAARDAGNDVNVIRLDAPIKDLVRLAHEFPSSTIEDQRSEPKQQTPAKAVEKPAPDFVNDTTLNEAKSESYGSGNKLVSRERADELRAKLRAKLNGSQLNSGLDPEILAMGTELAIFHLEASARRFAEFARLMADDLGQPLEKIKPYLRMWYNGARDGMEDQGASIEGMDGPDEVRAALATLDDSPAKQGEAPERPAQESDNERLARIKATPPAERTDADLDWYVEYRQRTRAEGVANAEAAEAAAKEAATSPSLNNYVKDMAPNVAALAIKALNKPIRIDGKAATLREHIEAWHAAGELSVSTSQEPRIKPMSRRDFNRATQAEQRMHEKRMQSAGSKTVYYVNDYDLGKTAHDYAAALLRDEIEVDAAEAGPKGAEPKASATPWGRFEQLRSEGHGEMPEVIAFAKVAGAIGEKPADVYNRWQSVMGFMREVEKGTGQDLASLMGRALVKEPYKVDTAYPGSNPPAVSDLASAQRFAERTANAMESFNKDMALHDARTFDAERFGVDAELVKAARDAIQQMLKTAAANERAAQMLVKDAEAKEKADAEAEAQAMRDGYEAADLRELSVKPTAAQVKNWFDGAYKGKVVYSSSGHIIDLSGTEPHLKGWADRRDPTRTHIGETAVDNLVHSASNQPNVMKLEPFALNHAPMLASKKHAVFSRMDGQKAVYVDLSYARYFLSKFKGAEFFTGDPTKNGDYGAIQVRHGGELVGILMPIRMRDEAHTPAEIRSFMQASGKDVAKPKSVVQRAKEAKAATASPEAAVEAFDAAEKRTDTPKATNRADAEAELARQLLNAWDKQAGDTFTVNTYYPATLSLNGKTREMAMFKKKGGGTLYATALDTTIYGPVFTTYRVHEGKLIEDGTRNLFAHTDASRDQQVAEFKALFAPAGSQPEAVATQSNTKPESKRSVAAKAAEAKAKAVADYFTPGNVVPSYGGNFDRVISYQAPDKDGHWSVTVRAVEKRGDSWVDKPGERERNHMTLPDARELKKGPVFVSPSPEAAKAEAEAQEIVISYGGSSMPLKLSKPAYQTTTAEVRERAKQNGLGASLANSYADKHVTLLRQALSADLNVPADVLADYPGLIRPDLNDDQTDQMVDDLRNLSGAEFVSAAREWGKAKPATASAPSETAVLTNSRRDPRAVTMFNPYLEGDIVTLDGKDWTVRSDMPGWYLTNTGNWRGQHPTIHSIKSMEVLIREIERAATATAEPEGEAFPTKEAAASYSGISHRGTDRAKSDKAEFEAYIDGARSSAMAVAHTQAQRDAVDQAIKDLRADYLAQYRRLMNVRAGTVSSFVAGGSKFNSKQASARNSAYDRAIESFTTWQAANTHKARKAALDARTEAEKAADADAAAQASADKAQKKEDSDRSLMRKILSWKKGAEPVAIGKTAKLAGVNKGKDGYPTSIKLESTDGSALTDDKFDLAALFREKGMSVPDSKRRVRELVDAVRAEDASAAAQDDGQEAKTAPAADSKTPLLDAHVGAMDLARDGKITPEQFRAAFAQVEGNGEAMRAEMNSMSKDKLLRAGGVYFYHRHKDDRKAEVVEALYRATLDEYSLGKSYGPNSYMLSSGGMAAHREAKQKALAELVSNTTADDLQEFAKEHAKHVEELKARKEARARTLSNPETLSDFREVMRYHVERGDDRQQAFMRLTPEQRRRYDELEAESTKEQRNQAKAKQRAGVAVAGQATTGEVIQTKHTKHGHDLWVVRLGERVSREDYETLNNSAKRMGGSYSSYRGNGAIPGFQFRTPEAAKAFSKLVSGDAADAQTVADARRDAFADDRSQSAVERLRTMAGALKDRANESLSRARKVNTSRRAHMAASAEAAARAELALGETMDNLAAAIESGKAKFLDTVRQKVQVEFLSTELRNAKDAQIRAKYSSYSEQEKHRGEPVDDETVDYATFPTYTAMRSDLAGVARQLLEVDGTKKLGARLLSVADDVSDAYVEWAKENLYKVSHFARGDSLATFSNRDDAERAIRRSGIADRAIVLPIKRGENRIVLSPSEAMKQGLWSGDGDKRITLSSEFGRELVEAVGRKASKTVKLPWQLESAYAKRKRLEGMGIFTGSEYRSALREFAEIKADVATPDKIKQKERSMIGRRNDGLDFFPTSDAVIDQMLEAAEITEGMAVLEPSAGMGHIADKIRDKAQVEPDVIELSGDRRELLEMKGYRLIGNDFTEVKPRTFFTFGDVFRAPDGTEGIMHGGAAWSGRASLHAINEDGTEGRMLGWFDRDELVGVKHRGSDSGYDRIIMNPPFSKGRDIEHVRHAYSLLKPGGRIVAIMGEGAFFQSNKAAEEFRNWLDELGATSERLPDNSFMDAALPVNTAVNARLVVIDKPESGNNPLFSRSDRPRGATRVIAHDAIKAIAERLNARLGLGSELIVYRSEADLFAAVPEIQHQAEKDGASNQIRAVYYKGNIHLVTSKFARESDVELAILDALAHEGQGHYGLRALHGDDLRAVDATLRELFAAIGGVSGIKRLANKHGFNMDLYLETAKSMPAKQAHGYLADELLAHLQGKAATAGLSARLKAAIQAYIGQFRQWLRDRGFVRLAKWDDTELAFLLKRMREASTVKSNAAYSDDQSSQFMRGDSAAPKTIKVDGKERQTTNSKGQPIHPTNEGIESFWRWFGNSKVVDSEGRPLLVYHGTRRKFFEFAMLKPWNAKNPKGAYFSPDKQTAEEYAQDEDGAWDEKSLIIPAYIKIESDSDGLQIDSAYTGTEYVVFSPDLIKSATDNNGNFDPDNADIRFRRSVSTDTQAFKKWFADSKAVDKNGKPLTLHHGTASEFYIFEQDRAGTSTGHASAGLGVFMTTDRDSAQNYAEKASDGMPGLARVMDLHASIQNPYRMSIEESQEIETLVQSRRVRARLEQQGYDGIQIKGTPVWIAFNNYQVKSATDNVGTFDEYDADIRFSRSPVQAVASGIRSEINKTFSAPGKLSLWHKTVGTMYNLAERSPEFKPVFESAQSFIEDVAYYAEDAAQHAPRLVPRMEKLADLLKKPVTTVDSQAIAAPIFEGTLIWGRDSTGKAVKVQENSTVEPGIVFKDDELRSIFNLTDSQIELYREFRAATDRSLDMMGRSEMLRFAGRDATPLREQVMSADSIKDAADIINDRLAMLAELMPDRAESLKSAINGVQERANRVLQLQREGYAPLSRFGKYTVYVQGKNGESDYFGMFESAREANETAAKMREAFPGSTVSQGTKGEELYKLFSGVSPESVELFGNMLGLDSTGDQMRDKAFQDYLRLTKSNRSAMKRLIHRKGIQGYSNDVGRVLASFIYSNSRQTAAGLHMGDLTEAVTSIPKEMGELQDAAYGLADYIKNPIEEAQAVRGLLFAQYLGGSVASAFVNMTQPVAVTLPWLSQFGGARKASAQLSKALSDMLKRGHRYEKGLEEALKKAEADGVVNPQEVHQLMAQARGSGSLRPGDGTRLGDAKAIAANSLVRLSVAWGRMFGAAEIFNRRVTYIASYRLAVEQGMRDPDAFARKAVKETQFIYSKASKMKWGRGAVGGTLMTFKTYSVAYVELMHRLWTQGEPGSRERKEGRKAAGLMLFTLMLMSGVGGIPFSDDLDDLVDGAAQLMGYNFSLRREKEQFLVDLFGEDLAELFDKGISGLPGMPMDVSGRLGLGNLIPGTGLLTDRTSYERDVKELAGPAGDFVSRIVSGAKSALKGNLAEGLLEVSPVAVRNAAIGADMMDKGMYRDTKGYKVLDTSMLEGALKAIGFQPKGVAKIQEANYLNQRQKAFYSQRAQEIRAMWAAGIFEKDQSKVDRAREAVRDWNAKNPDQPMTIRIPDVMRRVREMAKSKDQRIADTAPRAMRQTMRDEYGRIRDSLYD